MLTRLVEYEFNPSCGPPDGREIPDWNGKTLLHIAVHRGWSGESPNSLNMNAGDTCLNPLVRRLIDRAAGPFAWQLWQVWEDLPPDRMDLIQNGIDGIVIGGGGLFLREQPGTDLSKSGWTWNCPVESLERIRVPVMVFAVGYNRFRGHEEFEPVFTAHINKLADSASFIGLRNNGSIEALKPYLANDALRGKLRLQFCPTTVIWQLCPELRVLADAHDAENRRVLAFNCAFDRPENRFGSGGDGTLRQIVEAVRHAARNGWKIVVAAHKTLDRQIESYLDSVGVDYVTYDLSNAEPEDVMRFYARIDLAVGLRGHAQMIPFGLRRPILSIITHNKLQFFLDDIGHPEWSVDVNNGGFSTDLIERIEGIAADSAVVRKQVAKAQERVWARTRENFPAITKVFDN